MTDEAKPTWQKRVARWKASGESAVAFGAREGIKVSALYRWSAKLKREPPTTGAGPTPVRMMQLVRVPARSPTSGVIIDVPEMWVRVVVEPAFDRGTLAVVLDMLGVRSAA